MRIGKYAESAQKEPAEEEPTIDVEEMIMDHEERISELEDRIAKLEEQLKPVQPTETKGVESVQMPTPRQKVEGVAVIEDAPKQVEEDKVVEENRAEDERGPADRILCEKWKKDIRY